MSTEVRVYRALTKWGGSNTSFTNRESAINYAKEEGAPFICSVPADGAQRPEDFRIEETANA